MVEDVIDSDPEDSENPVWQIYDAIRTHSDSQGIALSDPFMRLPSRRFYPDYYQEIKHPISMAKIRAKIKAGQYRNGLELVEDLNLLFENAKKYNRPDSKLYADACKLQKHMHAKAKNYGINYSQAGIDSSSSENEDSQTSSSYPAVKKGSAVKSAKKPLSSALSNELKKARKSQTEIDLVLKKRMKFLCKSLVEYVDDAGRPLIAVFMEKPSKKDYPDYYQVIDQPIDMKTIEANVKWDRYLSEDAFIADIRLMFSNCKQYNEEGSQIYSDAVTLEHALNEKIKDAQGQFTPIKPKKMKGKIPLVIQQKLRGLYDGLIGYTDAKGRQLSAVFTKLPSKTDYPDYYEVIKQPLDLDKIGVKLKNGIYESLEDLLADLILMFDNACKYNEPDSQIYKDALVLQHVALQTKLELAETDGTGLPDVKNFVQDLLNNLFISVYNNQDEEGRCYSDSINEVLEQESKGSEVVPKPLTFDRLKRYLNKGKYVRLDRFQADMFSLFERARLISRTDSQAFEDSVELQAYFIRIRNDLCKFGQLFKSPALNFREEHLTASIETLKAEKIIREQLEAELYSESKELLLKKELDMDMDIGEIPVLAVEGGLDEVAQNDIVYRPGDFVYMEPRDKTMDPHIIHVEALSRDPSGEIKITGCWFYRPYETFHIASKRFLEKEVFRGDHLDNTPLSQIIGKCHVMSVKDYFKMKPVQFEDKDVYVCESRYFTRVKTFKKIKHWPYFSQEVTLVPRDVPLPTIRVQSVFKDIKSERQFDNSFEDDANDDSPPFFDVERTNVMCDAPEGFPSEEGSVFYEQFSIPSGAFKLGDCCYVRTDQGRNLICRVDRMWVDKDGNAFFHGPWFVQPIELPPLIPRMFYPQEVFLSSIEDTNPLLSICGKCSVLDYQEYITKRPTELQEQDIYVCESKFMEHEKKFLKIVDWCPKYVYANPTAVIDDEFYIFRKPLILNRSEYGVDKSVVVARKGQAEVPSPLAAPRPSFDTENEESNDIPPVLVPCDVVSTPIVSTPVASAKKKINKRLVTGYIIFASEVRKSVVQANPECNFGDISRIIGTEWKNLEGETKTEYEKKAQKQNSESAKEAAREAENMAAAPPAGTALEHGILECRWEKCDFQFEESSDLLDHICGEPNGHVWRHYGENKDKEELIFQCLFHGCGRVKKGAP